MNSELATLAERLTHEYEAAEETYRSAQAKLREVQAEIARVRDAAKLLGEPDPFAQALQRRRQKSTMSKVKPKLEPQRKHSPLPVKDTPRAHAEALFSSRVNEEPR